MVKFKSIVVLTGAGISSESGIRTFRAADGLWENHHIEDVATPDAFIRDPELVHRFYNERRQYLLSGIEPNAGHRALVNLEQEIIQQGGDFLLITQNIDDLHERAGSDNIRHMHGELLSLRCKQSHQQFSWQGDSNSQLVCDCCQQVGNLRPHIVWFGEIPLYMDEIEQALSRCDLFVSIGTSGNVYPAAGFFQIAKQFGAHTVELNLEASKLGSHFDEQHYGLATQVLPEYISQLLS
ncbi:MAG: NAD-dependent deacetylase [Pseudohongiellaceae bacterium]|jgi:NAD-dependent deacetylase